MAQQDHRPDMFTRFTSKVSFALGHPWVFVLALLALLIWGPSGPILGFSDTWQLVINTSTTIVTFLMVFIIQNTQNRDSLALNLKVDAILKALQVPDSGQALLEAEDKSDKTLEAEKEKVQKAGHHKQKKRKQ